MRRICYQVACSLDGFIAGPADSIDWIVPEPAIDFAALFARFDTLLMGRRTYEEALKLGGGFQGKQVVVLSSTLPAQADPAVTVIGDDVRERVAALRAGEGRDIWLFGGGRTFRSLLQLGLVDAVELAVMPVLLGAGVPFLPAPAPRASLRLAGQRVYPSGIVMLEYEVDRPRTSSASALSA